MSPLGKYGVCAGVLLTAAAIWDWIRLNWNDYVNSAVSPRRVPSRVWDGDGDGESENTAHVGADERWSPKGDVAEVEAEMECEESHRWTLASVLEEATDELEIRRFVEQRDRELRAQEEAAILAEVQKEMTEWLNQGKTNDALIKMRIVCSRTEKQLLRAAGVPDRRPTWDEATQHVSRLRMRKILVGD